MIIQLDLAVKPLLFEQGIKAAKRILLVELICLKHKGKATSEIDTKTELGKITTPTCGCNQKFRTFVIAKRATSFHAKATLRPYCACDWILYIQSNDNVRRQ